MSETVTAPVAPEILLNQALQEVKMSLKPIIKGKKNPYYKSTYADINDLLATVEPLMTQTGLLLTQSTKTNGQFNVVESAITHVDSGATVVSALKLPELDDPQKLGGAITYFRRYTLLSLLAMQVEDDDGNLASGKAKTKGKKKVVNEDF